MSPRRTLLVFILLLFAIGGIVFYAVPALAAVSAVRWIARAIRHVRVGRRLRPILHNAGEKLALAAVNNRSMLDVRVSGALDGFDVSIAQDDGPTSHKRDGLLFTVTAPAELPRGMTIASRDLRFRSVLGAQLVRTFEDAFDRWFEVHGRVLDVAVRLDPNIRSRMLALTADGSIVAEQNKITLTSYGPIFLEETIVRITERLLELARDLIDDRSKPEAHLLANAMSEPNAGARYQALDFLLREFSGTREADEAEKLAWDSPERGIKYLAAIRRGEAGLVFIEETAEMRDEPIRLRAMALRHVARHGPVERALPLLRRTLKLHNEELVRTAVELIGRLQDRDSLPVLVSIGRREASNEQLRAMIAHAIGQIADPAGEQYLLEELYTLSIEVRLAAVQALGKTGTPHALGALQRISTKTFTTRDLALAARSAIARIEARCGPGESGRLSIAEQSAVGGALSYQPEEGALSIKDDGA